MGAQADFNPYYAVIFTSTLNEANNGYAQMAERMMELAKSQPGYLGFESARNETGISVSYWRSLEDIRNWKQQSEHLMAQQQGRAAWYSYYRVRICKVERDYAFGHFQL